MIAKGDLRQIFAVRLALHLTHETAVGGRPGYRQHFDPLPLSGERNGRCATSGQRSHDTQGDGCFAHSVDTVIHPAEGLKRAHEK